MLKVVRKYQLLDNRPSKMVEIKMKLPPGSKFLAVSTTHTEAYIHVLEPVLTDDEEDLKEERVLEIYERNTDIHDISFGGARDFIGFVDIPGRGYEGYVFEVLLSI